MPAAQVIGTKPLTDQEEPKVNDGDFELISKIRCFAGIGYDAFGEHAYTRQRGNHDLSVPLPARRLFYTCDAESCDPARDEEDVDIDTVEEEEPLVETVVANRLLNECEKLIEIYRPRPIDKGEVDDNWDDIIPKSNWSPSQVKAFSQLLKILNYDRLSRLSHSSHSSEAILRRTTIERTAGRLRSLFTRLAWNNKLSQWLHGIIVDRAPTFVLLSYLEAMQVLYNKIPSLINQVINSSSVSLSSKNLGLDIITQIITKKCWDPVTPMLAQHKMPKLPLAPVFIVLGSEPLHDLPGNSRTHHWISLLTELGTVIPITSLQTDRDKTRMKMATYLDELLYTVRLRIQGARNDFSDASKRPIILVGINAGAPLMCHTALFEHNNIQGIICIGFSVDTAEGRRGEQGDRLLELTCPTLFVIGQCATTATEYDMEQIRKRLKCISGLIVVGGADDQLRKQKLDLMRERVTQDIVDRAVINEVAAFLSKALTMPKPTVVHKPVATLVSSLSTGTDGVTVLKVKEPRGKKDRGETKDGKVKRNYYQEKKRKLAELIAMGVSVDSSPKKQKREVPEKNPKILVVSAAPAILRTTTSNTLSKIKRSEISPRKSLEDPSTSSSGGLTQITIVAKPIPSSQVQPTQGLRDGNFPSRKSHEKNRQQSSLGKFLSAGIPNVKIPPSTSIIPASTLKLPASTTIQPASSVARSSSVASPAKTATTSISSDTSNTGSITSLQSLLKSHQSVKPIPPAQLKKKPVVTTSVLSNVQTTLSSASSGTRNIRVIRAPDSKTRTFNISSLSNVRYITTSTSSSQLSNMNALIPITSLPSGSQIRTVQVKPTSGGQMRPLSHKKTLVKPLAISQSNLLRDLTPIDILDAPIDIMAAPIDLVDDECLVEEIEEEPELQSPAPNNVKLIRINKAGVNVTTAGAGRILYK